MNHRALFGIAVVLLLAAVSCQFATVPPVSLLLEPTPGTAPAVIAADYPAVDGSTSALPLQTMVACTIYEVECGWQTIGISMTNWIGPVDPLDPAAVAMFDEIEAIEHHGTHDAYMNLIAGAADMILVARVPSVDEFEFAAEQNVLLDVRAVALDAFVFMLNAENPVESLSLDTIRAIYTGELTLWDDVPGFISASSEPTPILAYTRNRNSGSQELMEALVMQGRPMIDLPDMMLASMMGPVSAVSWEPTGIGYSVYFYATFIQPMETVKLAGIEGVVPTYDTIADRSYPLTTEVYVVVRDGLPPGSTAILLRDWLLTEAGQAAVAASGYVPY